MAHIGGRTIAVIRQGADHDGNAGRSVPFIGNFFVVRAFRRPFAFGNGAFDVFFWDVIGFGLGKGKLQPHIACWIGAAHLDSNGDFTADFRVDLAAQGIGLSFFELYIGPLGVSGHTEFLPTKLCTTRLFYHKALICANRRVPCRHA